MELVSSFIAAGASCDSLGACLVLHASSWCGSFGRSRVLSKISGSEMAMWAKERVRQEAIECEVVFQFK